jgi:aminoglycoside phosphotransferase family enzyme/predicted kinase
MLREVAFSRRALIRMLPDDLLDPEAWPEPRPQHIELIETHVSWVFRGAGEVLKVKKPVSLGFLDFGTLERRRAACEAEVSLNGALAPGVYLGVAPVVARARAGGRLAIGPPGTGEASGGVADASVVEWAVHMRRLDDAQRADAKLAAGTLEAQDVHRIAELVAAFHAGRAVDHHVAARWASQSAVSRNVHENFDQTRAAVHRYVDRTVAAEAEARQAQFLREHADLFAARIAADRIRDGHGDLRLEHVYLEPEGIRIIDCIEFDPRYRVADACADVAFLAMDLEAHGRADLAERLLARYARAADDHDLYALVDFYAGYRAWVRGKVAMLLAEDGGASEATRERAARGARRHFLLAVAAARPPLVAPTLVCVAGLIASGKSTVADAVAAELACPVVDADRIRKHMLGVAETQPVHDPAWRGAYDPAFTEKVYGEVLRRASVVLASRRPVVVDASFRSRRLREKARELARAHGVRFRFLECRAPAEVCRERLAGRARTATPSDGRLAIFDDFAARFEPVNELAEGEHVVLDTTRPVEESLGEVRAHVVTWPRGLVT